MEYKERKEEVKGSETSRQKKVKNRMEKQFSFDFEGKMVLYEEKKKISWKMFYVLPRGF